MSDAKDISSIIINHYESCLEKYGDSAEGLDWPSEEDLQTRYRIMLDLIQLRPEPVTLLDFGCGTARLYPQLHEYTAQEIIYSGLDASPKMLARAREKYPEINFHEIDIFSEKYDLPNYDYIIANGVFTLKAGLPFDKMFEFFAEIITRLFSHTDIGLAFNVMSDDVDWHRDDLFHVPMSTMEKFLNECLSRNFIIRQDYGLYEYTCYVYKK